MPCFLQQVEGNKVHGEERTPAHGRMGGDHMMAFLATVFMFALFFLGMEFPPLFYIFLFIGVWAWIADR